MADSVKNLSVISRVDYHDITIEYRMINIILTDCSLQGLIMSVEIFDLRSKLWPQSSTKIGGNGEKIPIISGAIHVWDL